MAGKADEIRVISGLVELVEARFFPFCDEERGGLAARGVENPPKMIGHVGLVDYVSGYSIIELGLSLDLSLTHRLSAVHDLHKIVIGDSARVPEEELGRPTGRITARIKKAMKSGQSRKEREAEFAEAVAVLRPEFESHPRLWAVIEPDIYTYFLWPKKGGEEARFVRGISKVTDAWMALWYCRGKRMKPSPRNVRTLTDEFESVLPHRIPRLYWQILKERYLDILEPLYRGRASLVRAQ